MIAAITQGRLTIMTYLCEVSPNATLYLDNPAGHTVITLVTDTIGHPQHIHSYIPSGSWTAPPEVWRNSHGIIVKLIAPQQSLFLQIRGNCIHLLSSPLNLSNAHRLLLQSISAPPEDPQIQKLPIPQQLQTQASIPTLAHPQSLSLIILNKSH